jgi:hypothetical protein
MPRSTAVERQERLLHVIPAVPYLTLLLSLPKRALEKAVRESQYHAWLKKKKKPHFLTLICPLIISVKFQATNEDLMYAARLFGNAVNATRK